MSSKDLPSALMPQASSTSPPMIMMPPPTRYPDGEAGPVCASADQRAVERGPDRADDLGDGEEDRESLGPDLDREDFADRKVTSARPGRGEEEHDDPDEGLGGRVQHPGVEQPGAEGQHDPGDQVGAGD